MNPGRGVNSLAFALIASAFWVVLCFASTRGPSWRDRLVALIGGGMLYALGGWTVLADLVGYRWRMTETLEIMSNTLGVMVVNQQAMLAGCYQMAQVLTVIVCLGLASLVLITLKK